MKKGNSFRRSSKRAVKGGRTHGSMTIGLDLGDKNSCYCVLDRDGVIVEESRVGTTKASISKAFGSIPRCRVAIEVGTHSPWVSRLLRGFDHEVVIANPRQVKLISASSRKDDRLDAHAGEIGACRSEIAKADSASQQEGTARSDGHPRASCAGGSSHRFD